MSSDSPLVFPVWVGPAQLFVFSKGRAYSLGLLSIHDGRISLDSDARKFDLRLEEVAIEWPRHLAGSGLYSTWPGGRCSICFGKPFPDAPVFTESGLSKAAAGLRALAAVPALSGQLAQGAALLGTLLSVASGLKTLQSGRAIGDQVRDLISR